LPRTAAARFAAESCPRVQLGVSSPDLLCELDCFFTFERHGVSYLGFLVDVMSPLVELVDLPGEVLEREDRGEVDVVHLLEPLATNRLGGHPVLV
jgi:hypothetical protein